MSSALLFPSEGLPQEVFTATSSSSRSPQAPSFNAGDVACPTRNTASGSGLPTPQTVRHEGKKDPQAETIARLPIGPTGSHFVKKSGPVVPSLSLRPPLTPSRSKTKSDHIIRACRTTPHSQRIVPSSQWSDDYQPSVELASSLEAIRDPFSVSHREEPNSCPDGLTLRPPPDIPSRYSSIASLAPIKFRTPTLLAISGTSKESSSKAALNTGNTKTGPLTLSSSSPTVSISSRDHGQCSQIVPTSQFDEIDLKWSSQSVLFACPTLPLQTNHRDVAPSVERCSHLFFFSLWRSVNPYGLGPKPDLRICETRGHSLKLLQNRSRHRKIPVTSRQIRRAH